MANSAHGAITNRNGKGGRSDALSAVHSQGILPQQSPSNLPAGTMSAVSAEDRRRWDAVYADRGQTGAAPAPPGDFPLCDDWFPTAGRALDVACGRGRAAVWMALRGLDVWGFDVSAVAIEQARAYAVQWQVADHCNFDVVDLDHGIPPGPPVDVVLCQRFRAPGLNRAVVDRLAAGGLLAISVLSEVGATPGRFRAKPGELVVAFGDLDVIAQGEGEGVSWLLARKPIAAEGH